jgi:hypothetical protein
MITLGDDLPCDTISSLPTSSIKSIHVNTAAGSWREHLQQFQVNLGIMSTHKGKGNQSPASQMLVKEVIDNVAIFEMIKQRRKAIGLIVQRKHCLMHKHECGAARFGQDSSLGDPIL